MNRSLQPGDTTTQPGRWLPFAVFLAGLTLLFGVDVFLWFRFGLKSSLYSYTLIIPFVSLYLLRDKRSPTAASPAPRWSGRALLVSGIVFAVLAATGLGRWGLQGGLDRVRLALLLCALAGGLFLFWGAAAWRARMFPVLFLFVMIPLAPSWEHAFNIFLQRSSGWLAYHLIRITGTPIVRSGQFLILPGLNLEVAEECSGIRSTLVLLITSALGAYLFFRRPLIRAAFVAAVIPLGIFRNAFRILVISLLTLYIDPRVIHGPLHRRGGPLFFGLSLVLLLLWLLLLRRWDRKSTKAEDGS